MRMKIREIETKSILQPSKLPSADYVVNPYIGCEFGCLYCYASFTGRYVNEPVSNWGNYVYVKANAVSVFEENLKCLPIEKFSSTILLSSNTDPYHGIEKKYNLTRGILEVLARLAYPGQVGILTKSPLVLRDLDVLKQLPHVDVGMTVTTTDDKLSRFLELRAPLASRRLKTLKRLHEEGLSTYAFVGPLLPHFRYRPDLLDELFARIAETKVQFIFVEHINLRSYIGERLWETLRNEPPAVQEVYREASTADHRKVLDGMVAELVKKYNLTLHLGEVLYHNKDRDMAAER